LIIRYAGRNAVEDGLGTSVNFFHLDCLASGGRLESWWNLCTQERKR
jgi:hypothetical protein